MCRWIACGTQTYREIIKFASVLSGCIFLLGTGGCISVFYSDMKCASESSVQAVEFW